MNLPVDVGLGNVVEVDQRELSDAAAREGFDSPRTNSADAYHQHMRFFDAGRAHYAVQPLEPAEPATEVGVAGQ